MPLREWKEVQVLQGVRMTASRGTNVPAPEPGEAEVELRARMIVSAVCQGSGVGEDATDYVSVGTRRVLNSLWLSGRPGRIWSRSVPSASRLTTCASAGGTSSSPTTR